MQDGALTPPKTSVRLHAYAASFGDDFARESIAQNIEPGGTLLDPWVGSATGPVQARILGVNGVGIDVDPVACLIARVSVTPYSIDELDDISVIVNKELRIIEAELASSDFAPDSWRPGDTFSLNGFQAAVPENDAIEFWFAPVQRAVLASLAAMSESLPFPRHQEIVQLAISSSIIRKWPNTISQARDIDHSRPHRVVRDGFSVASQIGIFRKAIRDILMRLKAINSHCQNCTEWEIIEGNTKDKLGVIAPVSIDYILTSPPYFNAIDYPRSHKFSHWWLWPERQPLGRSDYLGLMSGGKDSDEVVAKCYSIIPEYRGSIEALAEVSLTAHRNLCKYMNELREVVVQFPDLLKQDGKASFVVGNNVIKGHIVPTAEILADMLRQSGLVDVYIEPREINTGRRRYPYGIAGFKGLMTSEYVVHATKS